ncbi:MAG TPA: hypothetical protein VL357_03820 [Rariglobus sp.]|jgi:uncharacterized membrane protein YdjX (TVP38/TMEM64 family)|nr:hypothetical protein [Rariglobus sp.]
MSSLEKRSFRPSPSLIFKLTVAGVVLAGIALLLMQGVDLKALFNRGLEFIRSLGPVTFFAAMAVLPSFGCPLTAFTLSALPVFGGELGAPAVVGLALASITVNLAFSYWLARYALRPWVEKLLQWMGYTLPKVSPEDHLGLLILVRVTPGPPYALQNFVLGLTMIPFGLYMVVSVAIVSLYSAAFILFGDALVHGRGKMAFVAVSLFVAFSVGVKFLRRHYQRQKTIGP